MHLSQLKKNQKSRYTVVAVDIVKYFLIDAKLRKGRKLDLQTEEI
jgi:hypothetical protein